MGAVPVDQGRAHQGLPGLQEEESPPRDRPGRGYHLQGLGLLPDRLPQQLVPAGCRGRSESAIERQQRLEQERVEVRKQIGVEHARQVGNEEQPEEEIVTGWEDGRKEGTLIYVNLQ